MKLTQQGVVSRIRPTMPAELPCLYAIVGSGGFATVKLKQDADGPYLECIAINPATGQPWEIANETLPRELMNEIPQYLRKEIGEIPDA